MSGNEEDSRRVPRVKGRSRAEIYRLAHNFVRGFQPSALEGPEILDVLEALEYLLDEELGDYRVVESLGSGTEAETLPGGIIEIPEKIYAGAYEGNPRDRVTIIHECGHVEMHSAELEAASKRRTGPSLYRRDELKPFEDPEWQAFEFASYALAPTRPLLTVLGSTNPRDWSAELAARTFNLSLPAAESRLRSLEKCQDIPR